VLELVPSSASLEQLLSTHPGATAALLGDVAEGLEAPVQLAYLLTLMGFLVVGAFLVVRQVLIRRELEEAAKVLGERVRSGEASSEVSSSRGGVHTGRAAHACGSAHGKRAPCTSACTGFEVS
jgi:hypothetical protein